MNRDSSASDWDMIPDTEITSMPRAGSAFQDEDFFSSGQFQPVPVDRMVLLPANASNTAPPPPPVAHPVSNGDTVQPSLPKQGVSSTPATPSTGGGVSQFPPQLALDDVDGMLPQGFPSTTSVDSMFNAAGGFTHFSPQKDQNVLSSGYRGMLPSNSSSSMIATPTSPPPGNPHEGLADSCRATVFPSVSSEAGTPVGLRTSTAAAVASSFRPPLVPKLQLQSFPSPSASSASPLKAPPGKSPNGFIASSLFSCITPRVPFLLRSACEDGAHKQFLTDSQHATLRWEEPLQALVRWTMAMLTLDVLHTFTSETNTWTSLLARGIVLLMVCGRLFRTSQDQQDQGVVSSGTFGHRLRSHIAVRSDQWVTTVAAASHRLIQIVVLDTPKTSRSTVPGPSRHEGSTTWMDGFHAVCRVALVCGGIDVVLCQSPFRAGRLLDVAIFWTSFASLRVPLRIAFSDLLIKFDGVAHLRRSWLGEEGVKYIVKTTSEDVGTSQPSVRKGVADVVCWCGLQVLFAVCKALQPSLRV